MEKKEKTYISFSEIHPNIRRSALTSLEPGYSTGLRMIYHYQVIYIYEGRGEFVVEKVKYKAKKGNLFFWGPGQEHMIISDKKYPLKLLGVQFDFTQNHINKKYSLDVTALENFRQEDIIEEVSFKNFKGFKHYIVLERPHKAQELLMEIAKEYKMQKRFCKETMSGLFKSFLSMTARQTFSNLEVSSKNKDLTDKVIDYIHYHYKEEITNKKIAKEFNFHPNYLNRIIKTSTGVSIHKYLINLRINKAVEMINMTDKTISEVSAETGFSSVQYFSKIFKEKTGINPSSLRSNL